MKRAARSCGIKGGESGTPGAMQIGASFFFLLFFNTSQAQQGHWEGISRAAILGKAEVWFLFFEAVGRWPDQSGGGAAAATGSCCSLVPAMCWWRSFVLRIIAVSGANGRKQECVVGESSCFCGYDGIRCLVRL